MIRISRFFENMFHNPQISDEELRRFAADHLARLTAESHPPVSFSAIIAATDTALTAFKGKVADEATAAAIRKSRTTATNALMDEIKGKWSQREGKIRDIFGKDSPEYTAFYPQGVSEYRTATMEEMSTLLTRYNAQVVTYQAQVGQPFVVEWSGYVAKWTAIRGGQVMLKGVVTGAADQSGTARAALELQLQANILTVALQNIGQPDRAALFFNQSLLENPAAPAPAPAPTTTPATPASMPKP